MSSKVQKGFIYRIRKEFGKIIMIIVVISDHNYHLPPLPFLDSAAIRFSSSSSSSHRCSCTVAIMTKVNTMRNSIFFDFTWLNPRQCHRLTVKFNSETLSRKPSISISISTISISISPHLHLWVLSVSAYTAPAGSHSPFTNLDQKVCIFLFDLQLAPNLFLKTALTSQYETLFLVFLS